MATVLVVEDDGVVAGRMVRMLRKADHRPVRAADARSALREALDRPDVILLDLRLPDLSGQEILRQLRSQPRTADIPVVVVTGCTDAARVLRGARIQVADVLVKPVSEPQLCQAVDQVLAERQVEPIAPFRLTQHRQRELVRRLIVEGPDRLASHVYRRLCADRQRVVGAIRGSADVLSWKQIAEWAKLEGLLDTEQAALLEQMDQGLAADELSR
jgi:CheY-like chemotaxis protein